MVVDQMTSLGLGAENKLNQVRLLPRSFLILPNEHGFLHAVGLYEYLA